MKNSTFIIIIALTLVVFTQTKAFSAADDSAACDSLAVAYNLKSTGSAPSGYVYKNRTIWIGSRGGKFILIQHKETGCYIKRYIPNELVN